MEQAELSEDPLDNEAALRQTRRNLAAIYRASGDGLALCEAIFDDAGRIVEYQVLEVNRAHAELTGATREQMLTMPVSTIYPPIDPRWFQTAQKVLETGEMQNFDVRSPRTGRWLNIRVSRVSEKLFQQTFVDISDRHRLEEQRATLLKEMNHRVMNNFQMVAGFLHMQAAAADPSARAQLRTAEQRVQTLAKLHSLLAYADDDHAIDAADYFRELCGYLGSTIERPDRVTIICDCDEVQLPTDTAIPLGLIVTEMVSNSVKYAYAPDESGQIQVRLRRRGEGWTLTVRDFGRGLGDSANPKAGRLGMRLVKRFVAQIGAQLETTDAGGVLHEVKFR